MTKESLIQVQKTTTFVMENALKTVSVIIPFSKPVNVGDTIESVLTQDYPSELVQIIVVGKGSTALQERWPSITVIDVGPIFYPGNARNLGAAKATGEILLFLDDDCEAQENWMRENLAELENNKTGAVSGIIAGKSKAPFARCVDFASFSLCQVNRRREGRLWSATLGIRKEVFEEVKGFSETIRVHEDIDLCFKLNRRGYKTIYAPRIKVLHNHGRTTLSEFLVYQYNNGRQHGTQIESTYAELSLRNWVLSKTQKPLLYLFAIVPFALAGTLLTVIVNLREHKDVLILAPFILLGKISCHIGIFIKQLEMFTRGSWMKYGFVQTVAKILLYSLFKHWFDTPRVLTLFVTSRCNARCRHCFYWKSLNQKQDLTLKEIERLSNSLGKLDKLLISGGEPFLRHDLPEICQIFFDNNSLGMINIPTNGLRPLLIRDQLMHILERAEGRSVRISLSLDGTEAVHDENRGVPGGFMKVIETYKLVKSLQEDFSNLSIGIATCVTNQNYKDLFRLYGQLPNLLPDADLPRLTLLRGDHYDKHLRLPSEKELLKLYRHKEANAHFNDPFLWRFAGWANLATGLESIRRGTQAVPCEAGRILAVVDHQGEVRLCELLPPIGNIREKDFVEIWSSQSAKLGRRKIVEKRCHCTHECNVFESLIANPIHLLRHLLTFLINERKC